MYIIAGFDDKGAEELFNEIMQSLRYSGIGGRRSSGCGRFSFVKSNLEEKRGLGEKGKYYISISTSMAKDSELKDVLDGASYKLIKRSGYVLSSTYSEKQLKKRDFYMFAPGSVFNKQFCGDIFDVSSNGTHPVYRYAKPMLIGMGGEV
jgi:CRISPR-associated protein Csm4